MDRLLRRCLAMTLAVVALALILMVAGVPGASVLGLAPLALCLGMHLLMGHHGTTGRTSEHHGDRVGAEGRIR